jgi:hypothetical protein
MRCKSAITVLLLAGVGLGLSACYYPPEPAYSASYYDPGYYAPAPTYYGPAYYGPSVGVYYGGGWGGGWHHDWDHDHRWR